VSVAANGRMQKIVESPDHPDHLVARGFLFGNAHG
jgi:hypothetical protein